MAKQIIRTGTAPNDKTGDPLRTAFQKINSNFDELYASTSYTLPTASNSVLGGVKVGTGLAIDGSGVLNVTIGSAALGDIEITSANIKSHTSNNFLNLNNSSGVKLATKLTNDIALVTDVDGGEFTWTFNSDGNTIVPNNQWIGPQTHNSITFNDDGATSFVKLKVQDGVTSDVYQWELDATGTMTVPGSIVPDTDIAYDLGTPTNRFKDIHMSGSTIYMGTQQISASSSGIVLSGLAVQDGVWGAYDVGMADATETGPDGITCVTAVIPSILIGAGPFLVAPTLVEWNFPTTYPNGTPPTFEAVLDGSGYVTSINVTNPGSYPAADRQLLQSDGVGVYADGSEPWEITPGWGGNNCLVDNACAATSYSTDLSVFGTGAYTGTLTLGSLTLQVQFNAYKDPIDPTVFSDFVLHSIRVNSGPENFGATAINGFTLNEFNDFFNDYTLLINSSTKTVTQHLNSPSDGELKGLTNAIINFPLSGRARDIKYDSGADFLSVGIAGTTALAPLKSSQATSSVTGNFTGNVYVGGDISVGGNILPRTDIVQDLGSPTKRFRDLYLSGTTIKLGTSTISTSSSGAVSFSGGLTATSEINGVVGLRQGQLEYTWHDGIYTFGYPAPTGGSTSSLDFGLRGYYDTCYAQAVVNYQSGNYAIDSLHMGPFGTLADAIDDFVISGDKIGGVTPDNDLTFHLAGAHVQPDGTDILVLTATSTGLGGTGAKLEITIDPSNGTTNEFRIVDGGSGYPTDNAFNLEWSTGGIGTLITHINPANVGVGGVLNFYGSIVTNTILYTGPWYSTEADISSVSGTISSTEFFGASMFTLPITPRPDSTLTVTIGWWDSRDYARQPTGGDYTEITLDSSNWDLVGNVLSLDLPGIVAAGNTSGGIIRIDEYNTTTLNVLPSTFGPYTAGHYTIADHGFANPQASTTSIPAEYSLTLDGSGYVESVTITNRGNDYGFTTALTVTNTDTSVFQNILHIPYIASSNTVIPGVVSSTTGSLPVVGGSATFSDLAVTGDLTVSGDIHVKPDSIYLGELKLSTSNGTTLLVNDSPLSGGSTGDVTFTNNIIEGSGYELSLSPGTDFTTGDYTAAPGPELGPQYFRFRGGDNYEHLHFDTSNNSVFDLYLGDDSKYVKLSKDGPIIAGTNGKTWSFYPDGSFELPVGGDILNSDGFSVIKSLPQNQQSSYSNYTLQLSDAGKHVLKDEGDGYGVEVPTNASVEFPIGTMITIVSGDSWTYIYPVDSGTTEVWGAGYNQTSTAWYIPNNSMATLLKIGTDKWMLSGAGLAID